ASGPLRVSVSGVYYDYSTEGGGLVMDLRAFERAFGAGDPNTIALYLEPGLEPQAAIDRMKAAIGDRPLLLRSNRALRLEVFRIFDQTFAVTRILQAIALLVASSGILLTLTILARERKHELALFRSLGANRGQIFRLFLGKGIGMALFGLLLGTITGIGLAFVLVYGINVAFFGWSIDLHWPWAALGAQAGTIVLAALLAAVYPALQASRTPAKEMSREDV
ncbi:MAG: FtsX-like permease family protein, partial [Gemmatimonadetes bacterium]|nr:FtsX-like permease family protein [Gemmatimonadota bacterium]